MKPFLFLVLALILSISCGKNNLLNPLNPTDAYYDSLCESANGSIDMKVDGDSWGTSCAIASRIGLTTSDSFSLLIYGYTQNGVVLGGNGNIEYSVLSVIINNGESTYTEANSQISMGYFAGNYTLNGGYTNAKTLSSADVSDPGKVVIEKIDGNRIKGSFDFNVKDEDENLKTMKGSFDVTTE